MFGNTPVNECCCDLCQSGAECKERQVHSYLNALLSKLDEQERRWVVGLVAIQYNSISYVELITGVSYKTIRKGMEEIQSGLVQSPESVRKSGGGRKGK